MKPIAHIETDFPTKFGIPRQSGIIESLQGRIVFEPDYRIAEAVRGLEEFSHIWLIWEFSEAVRDTWSPTVRPPRLGGNVRKGVFATRSPFRPNPIGLSSVRLEGIEKDGDNGWVLIVSGADLMDGTPIYDIKPYLPGVDAHPDAADGFVGAHAQVLLDVEIAPELASRLTASQLDTLREILSQDPRPAYHAAHADPNRIYGLSYAGLDLHFTVEGRHLKAF